MVYMDIKINIVFYKGMYPNSYWGLLFRFGLFGGYQTVEAKSTISYFSLFNELIRIWWY